MTNQHEAGKFIGNHAPAVHQFAHSIEANSRAIFFAGKKMRAAAGVQTYGMNCLPNQSSDQASGKSQVIVSLLTTETARFTGTTGNSAINGLALEEELNRRADAMTDVLTKIMDRPTTPRFWGLNE